MTYRGATLYDVVVGITAMLGLVATAMAPVLVLMLRKVRSDTKSINRAVNHVNKDEGEPVLIEQVRRIAWDVKDTQRSLLSQGHKIDELTEGHRHMRFVQTELRDRIDATEETAKRAVAAAREAAAGTKASLKVLTDQVPEEDR